MKKTNIIALLLIVVAIAGLFYAAGEMSTYAGFADAENGKKVQVVSNLCKDKPMQYDAEKNANQFIFHAKDKDGKVCKVVFKGAKPQDFERSEQIVLTGSMQGDAFQCSDMLMKCPSKYEKEQIAVAVK